MKIAIVGGDDFAGDHIGRLAVALAVAGHEATVYVRHRVRGPNHVPGYRSVPIPVGPRAAASATDVLPYVGEWAAALEGAWSADRPDVVHAHGWLGGLAAQLAARRQRLPTVQTFLGLAATAAPDTSGGRPQDSERRRIEPLLARGATWVTGECTADVDVLARLRHSRAGTSALTSGVDTERFNPVGPAAARTDAPRMLCLAPNLLWCNGIDITISALARIPGVELVIAQTDAADHGHDDDRTRLSNLAADLGVADRVRFAGRVSDTELPGLLRSADVVACTPRQPPRATPVLQAMASGVAVVALSVGILCDAVVDNVTGLLLPTESPGALAAALRPLFAQSFQCESMGAAGRSRAQSRFSWERIALDALNIYQPLAQRRTTSELQTTVTR